MPKQILTDKKCRTMQLPEDRRVRGGYKFYSGVTSDGLGLLLRLTYGDGVTGRAIYVYVPGRDGTKRRRHCVATLSLNEYADKAGRKRRVWLIRDPATKEKRQGHWNDVLNAIRVLLNKPPIHAADDPLLVEVCQRFIESRKVAKKTAQDLETALFRWVAPGLAGAPLPYTGSRDLEQVPGGTIRIGQVTERMLEGLFISIRALCREATVKNAVSVLGPAIRWAIEKGLLHSSIRSAMAVPQHQVREEGHYTWSEWCRLEAALEELLVCPDARRKARGPKARTSDRALAAEYRAYCYYLLDALLCSRPGEPRNAAWRDLDLDGDKPHLWLGKHKTMKTLGTRRSLSLRRRAVGLLEFMKSSPMIQDGDRQFPLYPEESPFIFPSPADPGKPVSDKVSHRWHKVCEMAGVPRLGLHSLRSVMATELSARFGVKDVAVALGITEVTALKSYIQSRGSHSVMTRFDESLTGKCDLCNVPTPTADLSQQRVTLGAGGVEVEATINTCTAPKCRQQVAKILQGGLRAA